MGKQIGKSVFPPKVEQAPAVPVQQPAATTPSGGRIIGTTVFTAQPSQPVQQQQQSVPTTPVPQPVAAPQPTQKQAPTNTDDLYKDTRQTAPAPQQPTQPQVQQQAPQSTQPAKTTPATTQTNQSKQTTQQQQQLDYQTAEEDRLNQIRANLNIAQISNPKSFYDRKTFESAYNYATRSDAQKQILDAAYSSFHNKSSGELLDTIMLGGDVTPEQKKGGAYTQAMQRKMDYDRYSAMNPTALAKALDVIEAGSPALDDLKRYSPDLLGAAREIQVKNKQLKVVNNSVIKRMLHPLDANKRLADQMVQAEEVPDSYEGTNKKTLEQLQEDPNLIEAYRYFVTEDPIIIQSQKKIEEKRTAVNQINAEIANLQNRIATQMFSGDAPASYIAAQAAQLSRPLMDKLAFAMDELSAAESNFAQLNDMKLQEFQAFKEQAAMDANAEMQQNEQTFQTQQNDLAFERQVALANMGYEQQMNMSNMSYEQQKGILAYTEDLKRQYPDYQILQTADGKIIAVNKNNPNDRVDVTPKTNNPNPTVPQGDSNISGSDYFNSLGNVTSYGGDHDGYAGIDFDGSMGDPVKSVKGTVVKVVKGKGKSDTPSYGNFVQVKDEYGNIHQYSHLSNVDVQVGDNVNFGQQIGAIGNSGYTIPGKGGGDGSHLDYSMIVDGKRIGSKDVEQYLKSYKPLNPVAGGTPNSVGSNAADNAAVLSLATKLFETGGFEPKDVTALGISLEEFQKLAPKVYTENKSKEFSANGFKLSNPDLLFGKSKKAMEDIAGTVPVAHTLIKKMEEYKTLFAKYGNEWLPTEAKAKLDSLHKDITLNLKEAVENGGYNLGVLNGPDWSILTGVFPEVTGFGKITFNAGAKIDQAIKNIKAKINSNAARYGLTYTGQEGGYQSGISANSTDEEILKDLNNY